MTVVSSLILDIRGSRVARALVARAVNHRRRYLRGACQHRSAREFRKSLAWRDRP
jgi:hypothetical protein